MINLETADQSGSEYFARWVATCVAEPSPQNSSLPTILLCVGVGVAVIAAAIAAVVIKRRRARRGGGDGLGGLDQPILDSEIDGKDISEARTSW